MTTLKMIGIILKNSGLTAAIKHSEIATAVTADSFIHVASVTKTHMAQQVTACAFCKLLKAAFEDDNLGNDSVSFELWCTVYNKMC